ncbi:dynamin family protein [Azotobacter beijerinckii]|uniref:dynamin family protein n=1 Tax=Azotobacter beijerinckii TaxID=170623 RepID=UPI00295340F7|nr:dynamin family protein [Azotobacter beijerinckii]MDV7212339.1 dynamin family protein [Azotobacter beijerinckii]
MQKIEIHHRTHETRILINAQEPAAHSPLAMLMTQPLAVWAKRLFDELRETFNGTRQFEVRFQGSEADWQTLATAAQKARAQGIDIVLRPCASECSTVQHTVAYPSLISQSLEGQRSMQHIEITHNPFTVNTDILVSGEQPAEGSPLAAYREQRLQRWVEGLFDKLSDTLNGATDFKLTFKGVESDWLDIKEAAEKAKAKGMRIALEHADFAENGEERLQKIMVLKDEAEKQDLLNLQDGDFRETFNKALDRDFDVFVVATMSSGKSTLINSVLGQELLPAANEATTATIAEIYDNDDMPDGVFHATCYAQLDDVGEMECNEQKLEEVKNVKKELLTEWNSNPEIFKIKLKGNIQGIEERRHVRLVLTDTPGPNNSQNSEHSKTTQRCIQDESKQPLIIYVLNGTQLGTDDDKRLLGLVSDYMARGGKQGKDRFLFVANKMDSFDPEKENVPKVLGRVRDYLEKNGISHPQVYPATARLAYLLRKEKAALERENADRLTRNEQSDLGKLRFDFDVDEEETRDMDMEQYMPLSGRVKAKLDERKLPPLLRRSGIPALESIIDEYIDKYCFPYRVKHAYDALLGAIHKANNKSTLELQLDQDAEVLEQIKAAVAELKVRADKSFDVEAYKAKIEREGRAVPTSVEAALYDIQQERIPVLSMLDNRLQGEMNPSEARHQLDSADKELRFLHNKMVNAYEVEFKKAQDAIRADLKVEYQAYVQSLFPESSELNLPVLDSIKQSLGDISLDLGVRNTDVQEKAVYERQKRAWYNPRRWFGDSYTLERVGTKEVVDLGDRWAEAKTEIEVAFRGLLTNAQEHIQFGHKQLVDDYLDFMTQQFEKHVSQLMAELEAKLSDQKKREAAIAQAKVQLNRIDRFEEKLKATLVV